MRNLILASLAVTFLFSCKKNTDSTPTPALDSPAYSFFPGTIGTNNLSTVPTNDGNMVLLGKTPSGKILVLKLSPSGNELFRKELELPDSFGYTAPAFSSIVQTTDNGYLLCGTAYATSTSSTNTTDLFVLKLTGAGYIEWSKRFGGDKEDYGDHIIKTKDGNYLACGTSYSYTTEAYNDVYLVKFKPNGETIWASAFNKHEQQVPFNVMETKSGTYVVTGTDQPTGDTRFLYLMGVNASGSKIWENTIEGTGTSQAMWGFCTVETGSGDLMVCGASAKLLLLRTDATGNKKYAKQYMVDSNYAWGSSMKIDNNNNVFLTGGTGNIYLMDKCIVIKADQDGNIIFSKRLPTTSKMVGLNLVRTQTGDIAITGRQYDASNTSNIFFTRLDANGNYK